MAEGRKEEKVFLACSNHTINILRYLFRILDSTEWYMYTQCKHQSRQEKSFAYVTWIRHLFGFSGKNDSQTIEWSQYHWVMTKPSSGRNTIEWWQNHRVVAKPLSDDKTIDALKKSAAYFVGVAILHLQWPGRACVRVHAYLRIQPMPGWHDEVRSPADNERHNWNSHQTHADQLTWSTLAPRIIMTLSTLARHVINSERTPFTIYVQSSTEIKYF